MKTTFQFSVVEFTRLTAAVISQTCDVDAMVSNLAIRHEIKMFRVRSSARVLLPSPDSRAIANSQWLLGKAARVSK